MDVSAALEPVDLRHRDQSGGDERQYSLSLARKEPRFHSSPSDHHSYVWIDSAGRAWDRARPGAEEYQPARDRTRRESGGHPRQRELLATIKARRERETKMRRIRALENTTGRSPEEAAAYQAKADELRKAL